MRLIRDRIMISAIFTFVFLMLASGVSIPGNSSPASAVSNLPHSSSSEASDSVQDGKKSKDKQSSSSLSAILDIIEKFFRIAAYIIGGLWVYFNYLKGRTYKPRIEPIITGQLLSQGAFKLVKIVIKLKNVGLCKVDIEQEGTGLRLLSYDPSNANDPWKHELTDSIFLSQQWIEPKETVGEHFLFSFSDSNLVAVKAELILVSKKTMWESAIIIT